MFINYSYIIKLSVIRKEPNWVLKWRINAYYCWLFRSFPFWAQIGREYFTTLKNISLCEVNSCKLVNRNTKYLNIDIIFNSNSIYLHLTKELGKVGIIFMSLAKAILLCPKYIRRYMGIVISHNDNYFASLNSCIFTDGTFIYIPESTKCPIMLSSYFRINKNCNGQFERTLIILEPQTDISYFEGCNSSAINGKILHSAVVELIIKSNSCLKYSTLQNWNNSKSNGILNFVTKRALCLGKHSKIIWVQIELGSIATWKYPSSILLASYSKAELYSLSVSNNNQILDTGTKIYHLASNTNSIILSKTLISGPSSNSLRLNLFMYGNNSKNYTKCTSLILSCFGSVHVKPTINIINQPVTLNYESISNYISEKQLNYCMQRRISRNDAIKLIINGNIHDILKYLPINIASSIVKTLFNNYV